MRLLIAGLVVRVHSGEPDQQDHPDLVVSPRAVHHLLITKLMRVVSPWDGLRSRWVPTAGSTSSSSPAARHRRVRGSATTTAAFGWSPRSAGRGRPPSG